MTIGSSQVQSCCWVNGCQRWRWSSAASVMDAKLRREPVGNRQPRTGLGEAVRIRRRQAEHWDLGEALDRLAVRPLHRGWLRGPRGEDDGLDAQRDRAGGLDRQE